MVLRLLQRCAQVSNVSVPLSMVCELRPALRRCNLYHGDCLRTPEGAGAASAVRFLSFILVQRPEPSLALQRPSPGDALRIVVRGEQEDGVARQPRRPAVTL